MLAIYQWIRLNELYKLMKTLFFKFQIIFRNIGRKPKILAENQKFWPKNKKYLKE